MQNGFNKFKKKILLELLIKSIIIGLFISLITFSSILLYNKILEIEYNIFNIIIIAAAVFIVSTILLYIIRRPSKIKIAKRIDKQLSLNEKVQTMVEYDNKSSFMIDLQRETTQDILNKTSIKSFAMKFSLVSIIILLLSCAICVTAIVYPENEQEIGPIDVDPGYNADDWTIRALKDLIKEIEKSEINETLKNKYLNELNNLLVKVPNIEKESELVFAVSETIKVIESEVDVINTNKGIYEVLKISKITAISDLAVKIYNLTVEDISKALDQIASTINGSEEAISILNQDFGVALRLSSLNKNDSLYIVLFNLSENLNKCIGSSNLYESVNLVINNTKEELTNEVKKQKLNKDMALYIVYTLKDIFGLNDKIDDDNPNFNISGNIPNNPNNDKNNSENINEGGLGTGEVLVGSDDIFFDPDKGEVKYGDVITSYYAIISGKFKDGTLPEEYKEYFEKYFEMLFGTLEDSKEGK